jgi:hypothetical protein
MLLSSVVAMPIHFELDRAIAEVVVNWPMVAYLFCPLSSII